MIALEWTSYVIRAAMVYLFKSLRLPRTRIVSMLSCSSFWANHWFRESGSSVIYVIASSV